MLVATAWDLWQIRSGAAQQVESTALAVLQVSLLILFGLATTLILTESEGAEALRAARTIHDSAEALRASEARFRFVVEHSSDVQMLAGRGRRLAYVAPSSERVLGEPADALATAHAFARHAGGELSVESAPQRGTRFSLDLPVAEA